MAILKTNFVDLTDMPTKCIMQMTPGIFQEYVNKKYEVRANFFDNYDISVRINSVVDGRQQTDWRYMNSSNMGLTQISLPIEIKNMCI